MKKLLIFLVPVVALLAVSGCSKMLYSHEQVMLSFHTKNDVVRQFGLPDQKREANGVTEWLYNCDTASAFGRSKTRVAVNGSYNPAAVVSNHNPASVIEFTAYARYVKFTFDAEGTVLKWNANGVNFEQRKKNTVGTIFLVVGAVALALLLVGAAIIANDVGGL